jgi:hypothetical protein
MQQQILTENICMSLLPTSQFVDNVFKRSVTLTMPPVQGPYHHAMPLHGWMNWQPFKIDALGLVTLIGAEEVNKSVGRLVQSRYTTFLPLLGAYLIAGNQFTAAGPGYNLYNITDAVTTGSICGWFGRWLSSQDISTGTTVFRWHISASKRKVPLQDYLTDAIGPILLASLTALTLLMGDYWGLANTLAMVFSVVVRWYLVRENVASLDIASLNAVSQRAIAPKMAEEVTLMITLPNGHMVTMYAPRGVVIFCLTKKPEPHNVNFYRWAKRVGWLSFGIHVIALGQSNLVSQICTVVLLVASTWLTVHGFGCDEGALGDHTTIERVKDDLPMGDKRMWAYARVQPTEAEEDSMCHWGLLPRKVNTDWWIKYAEAKALSQKIEAEKKSKKTAFSMSISSTDTGMSGKTLTEG